MAPNTLRLATVRFQRSDVQAVALKRETVFAIDERNFNDSARVQRSDFRF